MPANGATTETCAEASATATPVAYAAAEPPFTQTLNCQTLSSRT